MLRCQHPAQPYKFRGHFLLAVRTQIFKEHICKYRSSTTCGTYHAVLICSTGVPECIHWYHSLMFTFLSHFLDTICLPQTQWRERLQTSRIYGRAISSGGQSPASHRYGPGLSPGQVMWDLWTVALGQFFSEYLSFPCQFSFHWLLHTHHLSSGAGTIGQLVANVPSGLCLTPPQELTNLIYRKPLTSKL
jgi:hypothetical protein